MTDSQEVTTEQLNRPAEALHAKREALRRARRLARQGDYAGAIDSLDAAMRLGADPYDCYLRQANLYRYLGRVGDALTSAKKAIERGPHKMAAREAVIALLLLSRDFAGAVRASRELLKIAPKHMAARDALGAAYMGMGDVDGAIRVASEMIRFNPTDPLCRFKKAMLLQHKGEYRMAIAEFERVLETSDDPTLTDAVYEHLEELDLNQLHSILLLAADDPMFRAKVIADPEQAITERGFGLTGLGLLRLSDMAEVDLARLPGPRTPRTYH